MTPTEYITAAANTNATDEYGLPISYTAISSQFRSGAYSNKNTSVPFNLLHMAIGIATESGELLDAIKKSLIYGKELDLVNMKEEVGDLLWYIAGILRQLGISFEEVFEVNIAKLKARFPNKFTEHDALNRDLEVERKILEDS